MTMLTRHDGSRHPDFEEQARVLADFTDPGAETGSGYEYNRTLGDLIVDVLAGRDIEDGFSGSHEDAESFEGVMLQRIALELRVLDHCLETGFDRDDASALVSGLARRVTAGAELAERLRNARWGHPCFGGGEEYLARKREEVCAPHGGAHAAQAAGEHDAAASEGP